MKKKFFYMKDKIKSKKERKSRKEEKINLNEILKDESYKLGTFRRNGKGFGFVNVGEEDEIFISPKLTKNALTTPNINGTIIAIILPNLLINTTSEHILITKNIAAIIKHILIFNIIFPFLF